MLDLSTFLWDAHLVTINEDWQALAEAVKAEREDQGLTQEQIANMGGPSTATMRLIEGAMQAGYRARTLVSLERALGWPRGRVRRILRHEGEPEVAVTAAPRIPDIEWRIPPEAAALTPEQKAYVEGLIRLLAGPLQRKGDNG